MNIESSREEERSVARASVRIKSDTLDTAEVTRMVGVHPTRATQKGEQPPDRSVPSLSGIWTYTVCADQVSIAAMTLLETIEPVATGLRDAAALYGAELTVSIYWQPEGGQGGYSLPADTVRRLSMLGERVDFYFA